MQTLNDFGGPRAADAPPIIVFAHANGYPPGSYRALLAPLAQHFQVYTVEHRPLWQQTPAPRFLSWQTYADDMIATLDQAELGPVWLVGHSMGAVTGMLAACRRPDLFHGIVALDPVLLPFRVWFSAQMFTRGLGRDIPIAKVALRRPPVFDSLDAAFTFYRGKRPFRRIADEVLWDYVHAGHDQEAAMARHRSASLASGVGDSPEGAVGLRFSGAWEACVYRSAPHLFGKLRHLNRPVLGIAGDSSDVLGSRALDLWREVSSALTLRVVEGGHLIPLEKPEECADLARSFIYTHAKAIEEAL